MDYDELAKRLDSNMHKLFKAGPPKKMVETTRGGMFILKYLSKEQKVIPSQISKEMQISTARIATALNSLEDKGLIKREIDKENRRQIIVKITPEGEKVTSMLEESHLTRIKILLKHLGEDDAKELIRITERIIDFSIDLKE